MTEQEARAVLRQRGWSMLLRKRRKGLLYVYAERNRPGMGKPEERYLCALSALQDWTPEELLSKLPE